MPHRPIGKRLALICMSLGPARPSLRDAVKMVQESEHLPTTGVADAATRWAIDRRLSDKIGVTQPQVLLLRAVGGILSKGGTRGVADSRIDVSRQYREHGFVMIEPNA